MKRYNMEINEYFPSPESVNARMYVDSIESPDGMWVKWEDVQESNKENVMKNNRISEDGIIIIVTVIALAVIMITAMIIGVK